jgi:hypothetical protein
MRDEFDKMIHEIFKSPIIDKSDKLLDSYKRVEKKSKVSVCPHDAFVSMLALVASQHQYGMSFHCFKR